MCSSLDLQVHSLFAIPPAPAIFDAFRGYLLNGVDADLCLHCLQSMWPDRVSNPDISGPGFDTRSGNILSFLLPLILEGQLTV